MSARELTADQNFIPKLLLLDLDGTLFNNNLKILESSREALVAIATKGIPICISTGRCLGGARLATEQLPEGLVSFLSVHNGAAIVSDEGTLRSLPLDPEACKELLELARRCGVVYAVQNLSETWVDNDPSAFLDILNSHGMQPQRVEHLDAIPSELLKIAFFAKQEVLDQFKEEFHQSGLDKQISIAQCGQNFADATFVNATKRHSGQWLADHFGVSPKDVLAFGDHLNDLDMLRWAGRGIAMGNGHPEVQKNADYTTLCHNSGGISHYLREVLEIC